MLFIPGFFPHANPVHPVILSNFGIGGLTRFSVYSDRTGLRYDIKSFFFSKGSYKLYDVPPLFLSDDFADAYGHARAGTAVF